MTFMVNYSYLVAPLLLLVVVVGSLVRFWQSWPSATTNGHGMELQSRGPVMDDGSKGFCQGMFMVMSMNGFQWSSLVAGKDHPGDCLNYLSTHWKLDDQGKFQGAMVYTILLGILTEGTYALQGILRPCLPKRIRHFVSTLLYGVQRFMGYIIMLVAMTYSYELLFSVLVGVMLGRLLFPKASTKRQWYTDDSRTRQEWSVTTSSSPNSSLMTTTTTTMMGTSDDSPRSTPSDERLDGNIGERNEERDRLLPTSDVSTFRRRR